jgi:Holliday junction resolvase
MEKQTRAPKLMGDFGEGLVTYALIMKGYEVACVDHVGADLIAEKNGRRFAISVKTRKFKNHSKESLSFHIADEHIDKLEFFAKQFKMDAIFAQVLCLSNENAMHLIMMSVAKLKKRLPKVTDGYGFNFHPKRRDDFLALPFVDYSCWSQQTIGNKDVF